MTAMQIYLIAQLDSIKNLIDGLLCFSLIFTLIGIPVAVCTACSDEKTLYRAVVKVLKVCMLILTIAALGKVFIPSSVTAATMYALPKVLQSETVKNLDKQTAEVLQTLLTEFQNKIKKKEK